MCSAGAYDEQQNQDLEAFQELAEALLTAVNDVTLEEIRQVDSTLESDSQRGRELLYLLSHSEWCRRTTEIIDLESVGMIQTSMVVEVDLSRVTHEALDRSGPVQWLPVLALPLPGGSQDEHRDGEFLAGPGVQVLDGAGNLIGELPQVEVRRQVSGALAGIFIDLLAHNLHPLDQQHTTAEGRATYLNREHQVLLSAVMGQVLRRNRNSARNPDPEYFRNRVQDDLAEVLKQQRQRLTDAAGPPDQDRVSAGTWSVLNSHAAQILASLRMAALVVVPVNRSASPGTLTLRLPPRRAHTHRAQGRVSAS